MNNMENCEKCYHQFSDKETRYMFPLVSRPIVCCFKCFFKEEVCIAALYKGNMTMYKIRKFMLRKYLSKFTW